MSEQKDSKFGIYLLILLLVIICLSLIVKICAKPQVEYIEVPVYIESELTDWQMMQMAIIKTESGFDEFAEGTSNDRGIFQITPIYVKEANRLQNETKFTHDDAFDIDKSFQMFNIVQRHHNTDSTLQQAILKHNSNGKYIGYDKKVLKNYEFIKSYEKVRKYVVNY